MTSRNIPKKIRKQLEHQFGYKCGFPLCRKPASQLHHIKRFSIFRRHNPEEIVPLCKFHHELVHAGLIQNEDEAIQKWNLLLPNHRRGTQFVQSEMVDEKFIFNKNKYR